MLNKKALVAALAATTFVAAGAAFAANEEMPSAPSAQQTSVDKDFGKLSADGARAYQDVTLTRLAIFDGRTDDAKKFIKEADASFAKAKGADTIFMKAESDLKTAADVKAGAAKTNDMAGNDAATHDALNAGDMAKSDSMKAGSDAPAASKTLIAWLPVDGEIGLNEDYTLNPTKAKAVSDANKSLETGDRKGAMDKLKLADVDMNVVLAVVPLNQTMADVHQAAQLIDSGKYYEGSQALRKISTNTRYDVAVFDNAAKAATGKTAAQAPEPAKTH